MGGAPDVDVPQPPHRITGKGPDLAPPQVLTVHPALARPGKTLLLMGYLAAMSWFLAALILAPVETEHGGAGPGTALTVLSGGMVFAALLFCLRKWFLPTRYRLGADGVEIAFLGRIQRFPWDRFRSSRRERGGWFLSPRSDPTRFDRFRGLFLMLDPRQAGSVSSVATISAWDEAGLPPATDTQPATDTRPATDPLPATAADDDDAFLARIAREIVRRELTTPAILFLESVKPMNFVGSRLLIFLDPIIGTFRTLPDYGRLTRLLENRDSIERLLCVIESEEEGWPSAS